MSARVPNPTSVLFAAVLSISLLVGGFATAQEAPDPIRIVLLPMIVHSAENPEYLRRGLSDMMSSRLERIPDFDVIRIDDPKASTVNLEKALDQARKADAEFVLFGSFTRFGTGASLDVQCAGVSGAAGEEPLREIFVHSGSIGDVIPDLDDLVGKVARFVIHDYTERIAVDVTPGELPSGRAIASLERRIEALEQAMRSLSEKLSAEAGRAGDVADAPADVANAPGGANP
jgi:TolB-like protein